MTTMMIDLRVSVDGSGRATVPGHGYKDRLTLIRAVSDYGDRLLIPTSGVPLAFARSADRPGQLHLLTPGRDHGVVSLGSVHVSVADAPAFVAAFRDMIFADVDAAAAGFRAFARGFTVGRWGSLGTDDVVSARLTPRGVA